MASRAEVFKNIAALSISSSVQGNLWMQTVNEGYQATHGLLAQGASADIVNSGLGILLDFLPIEVRIPATLGLLALSIFVTGRAIRRAFNS